MAKKDKKIRMPRRSEFATTEEYKKAYNHAYAITYGKARRNGTWEPNPRARIEGLPRVADFETMDEFKRAYNTAWRRKNKDKINAQKRKQRAENPELAEEQRERCRKYSATHKAEHKEYCQKYYQENREQILGQSLTTHQLLTPEEKEKIKERQRVYRQEHKDEINAKAREKRASNKDIDNEKQRIRNRANKNKVNENQRKYYADHKEEINDRKKTRCKVDIQYKLVRALRCRFNEALKGNAKTGHVVDLLGCTIPEFKEYIEKQFIGENSWMTWENHGPKTWHIDHVRSLCEFDHTDPEQVKLAWHYTNMRPLEAKENQSRARLHRSKTPNAKAA